MKPSMARLSRACPAMLAGLALMAGLAGLAAAAGPASAASSQARSTPARGSAHRVLIIGIPGLRWTDISAARTPALWRLAQQGSVGSLVVSGVQTFTCPADAWLTLNSGARSMAPRISGRCPRPAVVTAARPVTGTGAGTGHAPAAGTPASVPALTGPAGIEHYNQQFSYSPHWGLLATAAGRGQCAAAAGPGAALAVASRSGAVGSYTRQPGGLAAALRTCPLAVADLGALPGDARAAAGQAAVTSGAAPSPAAVRAAAVRAVDRTAEQLIAAAPAGTIIMVAGLGDDDAPHLRAIIISGPGYRAGLLKVASTRQPGLVLLTDLTPSVLGWRGFPGVAGRTQIVGSPIRSAGRGSLPAAIRMLTGQDTAAQVYRATLVIFFVIYGFGEGVVFSVIWLLLRGSAQGRRARRRAAWRVAAAITGSVPAGSFLASVLPWPQWPHPALLLYGIGLAAAAVIAAIALAGPWRRDPLGPPGFIGAVTIAVIGIDVMTGSHLQLGTPFGLSALAAGRFYGVGNNALGVYALGGLLCAAWAGRAAARRGGRGRAVAAAGAIALFTVIAAGWPGFGAKVGGTIAMVPGFLVLLAAIAGIRITPRRGAVVAVSGLLLITAFAVLSYLIPAAGVSDIGAFVGHVLHGGAGGILHRKVRANLGSLTENPATPIIPVVVAGTGLMLAWPQRMRLVTLAAAFRAAPLLRPLLIAMWLVAVLGWLADDSGVTVTATALPLALPLVIAIVTGIAPQDGDSLPEAGGSARSARAARRAANL